jgi:hypothetical protein
MVGSSMTHRACLCAVAQDIEVEDDVTAFLEYPNGATGIFITTVRARPGRLSGLSVSRSAYSLYGGFV